MPRGSFLINTSRGGVVNVLDVLDAITSGHLGGFGIASGSTYWKPNHHPPNTCSCKPDATPRTPSTTASSSNPHSAFYSEEGLMDMRIKGIENCRRALLGQPVRNLVNGAM